MNLPLNLPEDNITYIQEDSYLNNIILILKNIKKIIYDIHKDLDILNISIKKHKEKYLNTWYNNNDAITIIERIKENEKIFIKRREIFILLCNNY